MSGVIDNLVSIIAAVDGVAEVLDNELDAPKSYPAVVIEIAGEKPLEPEELPVTSLDLGQKINIGVVQEVGRNKGDARAARDTVLALSRKVRAALESNPYLGGACLQSQLGATRMGYPEWEGTTKAVAWLELAVHIEEDLS